MRSTPPLRLDQGDGARDIVLIESAWCLHRRPDINQGGEMQHGDKAMFRDHLVQSRAVAYAPPAPERPTARKPHGR